VGIRKKKMWEFEDFYFETIPSTQDWAKENFSSFAKDKISCVIAEEQTKGRGSFQKSWFSPKDQNIYATFYLQVPKNTKDITSLGLVLSLTVCKTLQKEHVSAKIKWPNDIQVQRKKMGGILMEISQREDFLDVFLGIGINVNMEKELLERIGQPATSLFIETGHLWDKSKLLKELKKAFLEDFIWFCEKGFAPFHKSYLSFLNYQKEKITCKSGNQTYQGILQTVTPEGKLVLELENGSKKELLSAEIFSF